ncbi:PRP38 family-domain-containing protein [Syncephalis pseudoplumigaleata]|uniref:Pre-mRNA-splicing factor 38 n=1 Tax=Syncephalis pseudoplumigaleata TaxID=1712513 RepID=A0A4P9YSV6_9FUNG|nr:PRP38 family-domain-containing protein [Syncephalis pseudoplumigaleata]|eukprot:RKP22854.1 PRP38 family-domain-containing protein [Syncephalis pseudoplumigaleata]
MRGTTPSSAFCLLYKLWTLRLSVRQVSGLLNHTDSPYIRGIGCLYVRYIAKPSTIWDWLADYLDDEEELETRGGGPPQTITIGAMCRTLLTQQKWCGTMLPRIPVAVARDIKEKLAAYDKEAAAHSTTTDSKDNEDQGKQGGHQAYDEHARHARSRSPSRTGYARSYDRGGDTRRGRGSHDRYDRQHRRGRDDYYDRRDERRSRDGDAYRAPRDHSRDREYRRHRSRSRSPARYRNDRR